MTWLTFQGSSVQHALKTRWYGTHFTLCGLSFPYAPLSEPKALRRERCGECERKASPGAQATLWEAVG